MPAHFIRKLTGKQRHRQYDILLGIVLAFIAGAVNAGGFIAVGYYTSHMTGIVSSIADYIALNQLDAALLAAQYLVAFIAGAFTSAIVINWARSKNFHGEFALALMLEAALLVVFGLLVAKLHPALVSIHTVIMLLCFIMGLQNAIITKISNAEIRTTHITGIATDIGIEIGRAFYLPPGKNLAVELGRLKLHTSLLSSFLIGGIIGAVSFKYLGPVTATFLAAILAVLASIPIADDFT